MKHLDFGSELRIFSGRSVESDITLAIQYTGEWNKLFQFQGSQNPINVKLHWQKYVCLLPIATVPTSTGRHYIINK